MTLETQGGWALILDAQDRVVSAAQARAAGMSSDTVRSKVDSGLWQRVYHGVYATFTGDLSRQARLWAVILRCGQNAVLSHETAAEIHGFARDPASLIHVTVPVGSNPARIKDLPDVVVHRSANWAPGQQPPTALPRTPVTSTVLDLVDSAGSLDDAHAWVSQAIAARVTTPATLRDALARRKKISKRPWLADALAEDHFPLELRWNRDVRRAHGLPVPARQASRRGLDGTRFLDYYYEPYNLAVELDGIPFQPADDRDQDRYRDNEAIIAVGANTLRYTFRQVANHPCDQAAQFAWALTRHGWDARTLKACQKPRCPVTFLVAGHDRAWVSGGTRS
jgi:hypothetical protein